MIKETTKYIIAMIIGLLMGLFLFKQCNPSEEYFASGKTKIDTIYQIKTDTFKIVDNKVSIKYKYKDRTRVDTIEVINDSIKFWRYEIDTTYQFKKGTIRLKQNGWGYVEDINLITTLKDTTILINKEITKFKPSKGLYISPEYIAPFNRDSGLKPTYKVNLDYVNNSWILGGGIGINNDIPMYGIRIGYKLK